MASGIETKVFKLIQSEIESIGVMLWDVEFKKEGAEYYLRVYIDKKGGVDIDTCTEVSHLIDPILDRADPIDKSYYLEVCSTGFNRKLKRKEHYDYLKGEEIMVFLYKSINGAKKFTGKIISFENGILTLDINGENVLFNEKEISKAILNDDKEI